MRSVALLLALCAQARASTATNPNALTARRLANAPAVCAAGFSPLGVDSNGNALGCQSVASSSTGPWTTVGGVVELSTPSNTVEIQSSFNSDGGAIFTSGTGSLNVNNALTLNLDAKMGTVLTIYDQSLITAFQVAGDDEVLTRNNQLDDGAGDASISGNFTDIETTSLDSGLITTDGMGNLTVGRGIQLNSAQTAGAELIVDDQAGGIAFQATGDGVVSTANNQLDDGMGDIAAVGDITADSGINILYYCVGGANSNSTCYGATSCPCVGGSWTDSGYRGN